MKKDFSTPNKVTIQNKTEEDKEFQLRLVKETIKAGDSLVLEELCSEELARLVKSAEQSNLEVVIGDTPAPESQDVEISDESTKITNFETKYYAKTSDKDITPDSPEFDKTSIYAELGEVSDDVETITINGREFDKSTTYSISIGKNSYLKIPVADIAEGKLSVPNVYLLALAKNGKLEIKAGNKTFNVTLDGEDVETELEIDKVEGIANQKDRKNEVSNDGNTITNVSNCGKQGIGIVLKSGEEKIQDTSLLVYRLADNGNMGITPCEKIGNETYTYAMYPMWKNGDYEDADVGTSTLTFTLSIPEKGNISLVVKHTREKYTAE